MTDYITKSELTGFLYAILDKDNGVLGGILARNIDAFAPGGPLESPDIHSALIHTSYAEARYWAAGANHADGNGFADMYFRASAQDDWPSIFALACNTNLPAHVQRLLISEHPEHADTVASFAKDTELLDELSHHPQAHVRGAVARNKAALAETLSRLATDSDTTVRDIFAPCAAPPFIHRAAPWATAEPEPTQTSNDLQANTVYDWDGTEVLGRDGECRE